VNSLTSTFAFTSPLSQSNKDDRPETSTEPFFPEGSTVYPYVFTACAIAGAAF
jgi:hypothetical protein